MQLLALTSRFFFQSPPDMQRSNKQVSPGPSSHLLRRRRQTRTAAGAGTRGANQPQTPDQDQTPRVSRLDPENDVNANRQIATCGKGVNFYSIEKEMALGKQAAQEGRIGLQS